MPALNDLVASVMSIGGMAIDGMGIGGTGIGVGSIAMYLAAGASGAPRLQPRTWTAPGSLKALGHA